MPQFSSVTQLCPTLCNPMDYSMPGFPVLHQLPDLAQTHVHQVGDAIKPSHPLSSPSPPSMCLAAYKLLGMKILKRIRPYRCPYEAYILVKLNGNYYYYCIPDVC